MGDRMDQIITAAEDSGFDVRQTRTGGWIFDSEVITLHFHRTPVNPLEWMGMVNTLRAAGMNWPPESPRS